MTTLAPPRACASPRELSFAGELPAREKLAPHDLALEARVLAAQNGDSDATEALLEQFAPLLLSRIHGLWVSVREELSTLEWADIESQMTLLHSAPRGNSFTNASNFA